MKYCAYCRRLARLRDTSVSSCRIYVPCETNKGKKETYNEKRNAITIPHV